MYSEKYKVRYSETGENMKATLPALMSYFQDTSINHSEAAGQGVEILLKKHLAWILAGWHVQILKYPSHGEDITAKTWATGFKGMYGYRNFCIEDIFENTIAKASSVWIYYDFKDNKFKKVDEYEAECFGIEELPVFDDDHSYKLKKHDSYTFHSKVTVEKSDIDTNGHVNNISYIKYISNAFSELDIYNFRIQYKKQAKFKDEINIYYNFEDSTKRLLLSDNDGDIFALAEIESD